MNKPLRPDAHRADPSDHALWQQLTDGTLAPQAFDHRAHLRVAYLLLCEHPFEQAVQRMRAALRAFLVHHGIEPDHKYHETLTLAWMSAVRLFMERSASPAASSRAFLDAHPRLLDAGIMGIHYSRERLLSDAARSSFVAPDRAPLPVFV